MALALCKTAEITGFVQSMTCPVTLPLLTRAFKRKMETPVSKPEGAVSAEDVKKIARLSRLHVEADRLQPLADDLNGILSWIEQLNEVDVEGVEPMTSAVDMSAPLRADAITDGDKRDDVLKNAPKKDDGFFVVPRSVE